MQTSVIRRARRRRRRVAAGMAALLLAAAPAAAQAEGWIHGPRFDVRYPAQEAALAVAPNGASYATWIQDGGSGAAVAFQHAAADGRPGPVHTLPDAVGSAPPAIAVGDAGAAAVWVRGQAGPAEPLQLTLLAPDGTPRETVELDDGFSPSGRPPAVAVAPDGDALAVWAGFEGMGEGVKAMRVAADGTPGPELDLGPSGGGVDAALAPDGTGWVTWTDDTGAQQVARVDADGTQDGLSAALPVGDAQATPSLTASAAGTVFTGVGDGSVQGVRLPLDGPLVGSSFTSSTSADEAFGASTLLADDGTVTLAWTQSQDTGAPRHTAMYSRIAPGAAGGPAQALAPEATGWGSALPRLAQAPDGGLLATWVAGDSDAGGPLVARRSAADGTLGTALRTGLRVPLPLASASSAERVVPLVATPDGGGFAAVVDRGAVGPSAIETAVLDVTLPQVAATFPAGGLTGEQLAFSATAADRAGVSYSWDFGDGSGARAAGATHAYALPGDYAVTLTVTDGAGNVTATARSLPITYPPPRPPPPICACGPPPTPPVDRPPVPRADAALRLTSAVRRGTTVTVTGTIAASATGRVSLVYAQRQGRRTLTATTSARIAGGRFRATIRLTRALAKRFRLKPTVRAAYAGNTATAAGEVARTVTVRAAARRARRRGAAKRRR